MQNVDGLLSDGSPGAASESGRRPAAALRRERTIIFFLCVCAAARVLIFSAAFPFFNNVDEPAQLDLVLQYSHGHVPRREENTSREASVYLALFCSCAYLGTSTGEIPPPPWTEPEAKMRQDLIVNSAGWRTQKNYEDSGPPLYYTLAALWWHIGRWLGFAGGRLLYWLRFFNVLPVVLTVWVAYLTACLVFPEQAFIRLCVPALLAFMPQTAFYSIGNSVLSPLCFGITFLCLIKWLSAEEPPAALSAATGLAFSATYLTKLTNVPLLAVTAAAVLLRTGRDLRRGKARGALIALAAFGCGAVPPLVGWMAWCKLNFGDFTGASLKMEHFGWTVKPFGQWWHHPIFTPVGFWTYLSGQLATFWQGEFEWYRPPQARPLALPGTGLVYTVFSLFLICMALPGLRRRGTARLASSTLRLSLVCVVAALGFFGFLSVIYDFHNCVNPSREHPYFRAGRMLLGMLIPFLLLTASGLDRALGRFGNSAKFGVLAVLVFAMLAVEVATDWPAFFNAYNWYHMPG